MVDVCCYFGDFIQARGSRVLQRCIFAWQQLRPVLLNLLELWRGPLSQLVTAFHAANHRGPRIQTVRVLSIGESFFRFFF